MGGKKPLLPTYFLLQLLQKKELALRTFCILVLTLLLSHTAAKSQGFCSTSLKLLSKNQDHLPKILVFLVKPL